MVEQPFARLQASDSSRFEPCSYSPDLAIFFSDRPAGFAQRFRFTFHSEARDLPVNRLFLRDMFGLWFHGGLDGVTGSVDDTAALIRAFVADRGFRRVTVFGAATGGYAALMHGPALGADQIVCLRPVVTGAPGQPGGHGILADRLRGSMQRFRTPPRPEARDQDARARLVRLGTACPPVQIHFDPLCARDARQARSLADLPSVELVRWPGLGQRTETMIERVLAEPGFVATLMSEAPVSPSWP